MDIKSCPNCGNSGILIRVKPRVISIKCDACWTEGEDFFFHADIPGTTMEAITSTIAKWSGVVRKQAEHQAAMTNADLKPCPFCGGTEHLEIPDTDFGVLPLVVCRGCRMQGPTAVISPCSREKRISAIVQIWNTRAG